MNCLLTIYSLQGVPDTTNEELLGAGGTFFSTSIDGYNWSRLSWVAEWNEELGHFDCKLSDLDDKSNYMFTLGMNKPTKISWRGYETNVISINPTNLADGDSGFSGAGYYIALPNKSPSDYPSYAQVYSVTGWGGTNLKGNEYFAAVLGTEPAKIKDERQISEEEKAQDPSLADFDTTSTLTGLERIDISVNLDGIDVWTAAYMKWDISISLSEEKNIQTGNCILCYVDGPTNKLESVKGVYYAKYNADRQTVVEVIVGSTDNPIVKMDITRDSSTNVNNIKISALNLPISVFEPNSRQLIQITESTLANLSLIDEEQSIAVKSRQYGNGWFSDRELKSSIGTFNQGTSNRLDRFENRLFGLSLRGRGPSYYFPVRRDV